MHWSPIPTLLIYPFLLCTTRQSLGSLLSATFFLFNCTSQLCIHITNSDLSRTVCACDKNLHSGGSCIVIHVPKFLITFYYVFLMGFRRNEKTHQIFKYTKYIDCSQTVSTLKIWAKVLKFWFSVHFGTKWTLGAHDLSQRLNAIGVSGACESSQACSGNLHLARGRRKGN